MLKKIMRGAQFNSALPQKRGLATAGVVRISFERTMMMIVSADKNH